MKLFNSHQKAIERRKSTIKRLEEQLLTKTKTVNVIGEGIKQRATH